MKKTYQTPSVNVTFVHTIQMMALSLNINDTGADADVVLTREDLEWDIWGDGASYEEIDEQLYE